MKAGKQMYTNTPRDLRSIRVPEDPVQVEFCPSWNWEYKWPTIYVYRRKSSWNPNSNVKESPRRLLASSSILPPPSSHCTLLPAMDNTARVSKILFHILSF